MPSNSAEYQRSYNTQYKRRYKTKLRAIAHEAKARPCADCGVEYPHFVMDFDHGTNEKLFPIGSAIACANVSPTRLLAEIAKCEVVCANCHRLRHHSTGTL